MRLAYLMSPIDSAKGIKLAAVRAEARGELLQAGFLVYDPSVAWAVPKKEEDEADGRLWCVNTEAMRLSDVGLAVLLRGMVSIGVPMEIEYMTERNTPVVVVTDVKGSFALRGSSAQVFGLGEVAEAVRFLAGWMN